MPPRTEADDAMDDPPPLVSTGRATQPRAEGEGPVDTIPKGNAATRYRYTNWNDLHDVEVTGSKLHSPRVRLAPPREDSAYIAPPEEVFAPDAKLGRRRQATETVNHRLKLEAWDEAEDVNLSYQELGDAYQLRNFMRILRRMLRVKRLHIADNMLTDVSSVRLPNCEELHAMKNAFSSFKCLPNAPLLRVADLSFNNISSFDGLRSFKHLRVLNVRGNP
eukprot:Opistho-1_new@85631